MTLAFGPGRFTLRADALESFLADGLNLAPRFSAEWGEAERRAPLAGI